MDKSSCVRGKLDSQRLRILLTGTVNKIVFLPEVTSTNDYAAKLGVNTSLPVLICCESQTAGRGRHGRVWAGAPLSSLLFTLLTRCNRQPSSGLSLAGSIGVARALSAAGAPVSVKWPNDIVIAGVGKIAGLLTEVREEDERIIIGVGINLHNDGHVLNSAGAGVTPTFLADHAGSFERNALLAEVVRLLASYIAKYDCSGFASMRNDWLSVSTHKFGDQVTISLPNGDQMVGKFTSVSNCGELLATCHNKNRTFSSAEIVDS